MKTCDICGDEVKRLTEVRGEFKTALRADEFCDCCQTAINNAMCKARTSYFARVIRIEKRTARYVADEIRAKKHRKSRSKI